MDGSTTVALVGIVATALVGVATPIVTAVSGHFSRRDERRASREEEFRDVAEKAALRLTEALLRVYRASSEQTVALDTRRALLEDSEQLLLNEDRLDIRVGRDAPESRHYHAAVQAWQRAYSGPNGVTVDLPHRNQLAWEKELVAAQESFGAFKSAAAGRVGPGTPIEALRPEWRR